MTAPPALRGALAVLAVAVGALSAFGHITHGFRAITADGARRADIARSPRTLPDLPLVDAAGEHFSLAALPGEPGHDTLVTLVYTQCTTVCRTTASGQAYLQQQLRQRGLADTTRLLTLSFDPARDTPDQLARYARRLRADATLWRFATVTQRDDLLPLLNTFGIIVLPDLWGEFSHNAALFRVDGQGRLVQAYDVDRPDDALADLLRARRG